MAMPLPDIARVLADRIEISEADARHLLIFGDYRPMDGDIDDLDNDPTDEQIEAYKVRLEALRLANHWTVAGITRNVKEILDRRGSNAPGVNHAANLRKFLEKVAEWDDSGVLQRAADFSHGYDTAGGGAILAHSSVAVVANLLTALDPNLLSRDTLTMLKSDTWDHDEGIVPRRLAEVFTEMDDGEELASEMSAVHQQMVNRSSGTRH